ncbi:hypothetical protein BY996DRAFT_6856906 [Phakopsora pachyrhizi]|nr:hypothetical protein BY996DRAFT_6856906 [Phakopsora pachyrhizi]
MCGFVNWRRRKVCMRCFPFADGNDSVGAMMAINAQRAALLAAGIPIPKDFPTSANNLSSPSDSVFQSSKVSNTQDTLSPSSNSMIGLGQIFSPTGVVSKRIPDSEGISQRPTNVMSPFDKAFNAGLQKISTEKLNNRPNDAVINHRFSSGNLKSRAIDRSNANSLMACGGRSERNGDQARLCLPVDENSEQDDRVEWSEEGLIPTRHRSFSMGANMVWGNSGICDSRGDEKSEIRLESMSRDKLLGGDGCMELKSFKDEAKKFDEFGGIFSTEGLIGNTFTAYGNKDFEGGKNTGITAIGRIKDQQQQKQQEESSPIRQRTTTGSESSWQAIKALWQ